MFIPRVDTSYQPLVLTFCYLYTKVTLVKLVSKEWDASKSISTTLVHFGLAPGTKLFLRYDLFHFVLSKIINKWIYKVTRRSYLCLMLIVTILTHLFRFDLTLQNAFCYYYYLFDATMLLSVYILMLNIKYIQLL